MSYECEFPHSSSYFWVSCFYQISLILARYSVIQSPMCWELSWIRHGVFKEGGAPFDSRKYYV